jgi:3-dehydroquinate synthase class II
MIYEHPDQLETLDMGRKERQLTAGLHNVKHKKVCLETITRTLDAFVFQDNFMNIIKKLCSTVASSQTSLLTVVENNPNS